MYITTIILTIIASVFIIFFASNKTFRKLVSENYIWLIVIGLTMRILATQINILYETDVNDFKFWSKMVFEDGMSNFYITKDVFTDYPPGYMYVLYVIGGIRKLFNLPLGGYAFTLLIKMPAIICDIVTGVFIYKIACKKMITTYAWLISLAYLLNPAVILDSSIWGQVDSVYTLVVLISIYYISEKKYTKSFMIYAFAILIKPQALIFAPIYIYAAYDIINIGEFKLKAFKDVFVLGLLCLLVIILGIIPFTKGLNFMPVYEQYKDTLSSYPYATVNAYNFYALIRANWVEITNKFLYFNYTTWGIIFIDIIVLLSLFLLNRNKTKANYFYIAALINTLTFMFSIKMHERYLFPSLLFFLIAFIYNFDKKIFFIYVFYSITFIVNCVEVLNMVINGNSLVYLESITVVSFLNFLFAFFVIIIAFVSFTKDNNTFEIKLKINPKYIVFIIMGIYSVIAFYNLGDRFAPESVWDVREVKEETGIVQIEKPDAIVDFGRVRNITQMQYMLGAKHDQKFILYTSEDGLYWDYYNEYEAKSVFAWKDEPVSINTRFIKVIANSDKLMINEMGFRENGVLVDIVAVNEEARQLFDEQHYVPIKSNFMNSTYFDEIYHARTAYEFINHMDVYEWTHPPLGKYIISLGINMFGMNPFGWRFMGTLFGVFMIYVIYAFAKKVFRSEYIGIFAALILSLDFMHFAQTRISTIDTYVTFFVLCMYYFMYAYYDADYWDSDFKAYLNLGLSGLFMGLAIASKWQGVYAVIGIAVLFFISLYKKYIKFKTIEDNNNIFKKYVFKTISLCVVFFILIPLIVYYLAYIPYLNAPHMDGIKSIISNQTGMYNYHSKLESTHPFSSVWWQWALDIRPIFYFSQDMGNGIKQGISSFGNPIIWWFGIVAFIYCIYAYIKERNNICLFLIIAFLSQYLPWVIITRTTYIYHYFPSVPFIIIMIAFCIKEFFSKYNRYSFYIFASAAAVLFVMFYPVLSGMSIEVDYVKRFLEWLPSWGLI